LDLDPICRRRSGAPSGGGIGCKTRLRSARSAGCDNDGALGALHHSLRDASEQSRSELSPPWRTEHDQIGVNVQRLGQDRLGNPVHDRVPDLGPRSQPSHPEVEDGRLGLEGRFAAALSRVPRVARKLAQAAMHCVHLRRARGRQALHQVEYGLALTEVINCYKDSCEHHAHMALAGSSANPAVPLLPAFNHRSSEGMLETKAPHGAC
jgi:hypothetical protein